MKKFQSLLLSFLVNLVGWMPLAWIRAIGVGLGWITFKSGTRAVHVTRVNLRLCYPHLDDHAREALCKKSLIETAKTGGEICYAWSRPLSQIQKKLIQVDGEAWLKDGLAKGKGVVILAPHLGNWEFLGHYLSTVGPTMNLFQPPKNNALTPVMLKGRTSNGAQLVPTSAKGVAALLKHLKKGGICGILPDQVPLDASAGIFAPFFGHLAHTVNLPQKLVQKNNSAAIFAFAKRVDGGFEIVFRPAPEGIYASDTQVAAAALNLGVEQLLAEAPEQYQWEYKRFRARPTPESQDPYTS